MRRNHLAGIVGAALLSVASVSTMADSGHDHDHGSGTAAVGRPGSASAAMRTIEILMHDNAYQPKLLRVRAGETVRFVVRNRGELLHEFSIGTAAMHAAHQKEMMAMSDHGMLTPTGIDRTMMNMDHAKMGLPDMRHDDPNSVLVEPGKTSEIVWTFPREAELEFACNIPGHYQAGMVGRIAIEQ